MPAYDYKTIAKNIDSVLTGEIWEVVSLGELKIIPKIKNVDNLPRPELQNHEVMYRNKTLRFPKYAKSDGEITLVLIEDASSTVRKALYDAIETQLKDGKIVDNKVILGDVSLKVYKDTQNAARTYTLHGSIVTSIEDSLTFAEEDGQPSEITLTIAYSDYSIIFE